MAAQTGLCRTCSETTLLVIPRGGSILSTMDIYCLLPFCHDPEVRPILLAVFPHQLWTYSDKILSHLMGKPTMWFSNRSDTNRPATHRCGFAPRSGRESHVGQAKFCLRVCQVVFPRVLRFSPHLPIDSSRYE